MNIDIEELREDMKQECYGAFFGGVLIESFNIDEASLEELVIMAQDQVIDQISYE